MNGSLGLACLQAFSLSFVHLLTLKVHLLLAMLAHYSEINIAVKHKKRGLEGFASGVPPINILRILNI